MTWHFNCSLSGHFRWMHLFLHGGQMSYWKPQSSVAGEHRKKEREKKTQHDQSAVGAKSCSVLEHRKSHCCSAGMNSDRKSKKNHSQSAVGDKGWSLLKHTRSHSGVVKACAQREGTETLEREDGIVYFLRVRSQPLTKRQSFSHDCGILGAKPTSRMLIAVEGRMLTSVQSLKIQSTPRISVCSQHLSPQGWFPPHTRISAHCIILVPNV